LVWLKAWLINLGKARSENSENDRVPTQRTSPKLNVRELIGLESSHSFLDDRNSQREALLSVHSLDIQVSGDTLPSLMFAIKLGSTNQLPHHRTCKTLIQEQCRLSLFALPGPLGGKSE
jgi:hypothetical protein